MYLIYQNKSVLYIDKSWFFLKKKKTLGDGQLQIKLLY